MFFKEIFMKKNLSIIASVFVFLVAVLCPVFLQAEEVVDYDFGYSLDIPEGFKVAEYTEDGMSYRFSHDRFPVSLILKLYQNKYSDEKTALIDTLDKLNAKYDIDTFSWVEKTTAVSSFSMQFDATKPFSGWGLSVSLDNDAILTLLCYCDDEKSRELQPFVLSTLNSLVINDNTKTSPGVFTCYAYPKTKEKDVFLTIGGRDIFSVIDSDDVDASKFLIDTEYKVLSFYAENEKWKEAWKRYYKAIFRDSYARLKNVSRDVEKSLMPLAKKRNPKSPMTEINAMILQWLQNFKYERQNKKPTDSDFASLPAILCGDGSDCDSRSVLACVLLKSMGMKTALFISQEYKHAVYGVDLNKNGAKITVENTSYLLNETTAKNVAQGLIASDMNDTEKWIPVEF